MTLFRVWQNPKLETSHTVILTPMISVLWPIYFQPDHVEDNFFDRMICIWRRRQMVLFRKKSFNFLVEKSSGLSHTRFDVKSASNHANTFGPFLSEVLPNLSLFSPCRYTHTNTFHPLFILITYNSNYLV